MKLYPTATERYIRESGRLNTQASRDGARYTLGPLQRAWPDQHVGEFTARQLTVFCLSGNPAPNTVRSRRNKIRSFYEYAEFAGWVKTNPATALKFTLNPSSNHVRDGVWLTPAQRRQVLEACDDTLVGRRDELVILFGILCGLRRVEIPRLKWEDFDDDLSSFKLTGKGNKRVTVGVPPLLREKLLAWRQMAPDDAVAVIPQFKQGFLPSDQYGVQGRQEVCCWDLPLGPDGVHLVTKRISERVPFRFRAHDLRRTYAGILEEKGLELKQIQELMRHNNINTTDRYLARNPAKTVEIAQRLEIDL